MYTRLLEDLSRKHYIALVLTVALLAWTFALPAILKAQHDTIQPGPLELQIILSDSAPGMTATHTISFKIATGTIPTFGSGDTLTIAYQEAGEAASSTTNNANFDVGEAALVSVEVGEADQTGDWSIENEDGEITFILGEEGSLAEQDVVNIVVSNIVNPNYDGGFEEHDPLWATTHEVWFTLDDSEGAYPTTKTRVAIIPAVTMTAAIDTVFEFSVAGLAESTPINGVQTTHASTPTALDFGTLSPGEDKLLGHELQVATNASNGFIVTIQETQELTSSLGERIHRFANTAPGDVGQDVPVPWTAPTAQLDDYKTYGHYGITTDDAGLDEVTDENDANFTDGEEGGYIGNFHQEPRVIFGHHGPTDAGTQNTGLAKVGVRIEVSSLQPAGDDYTNTLVYVATPTF